MGNTLPLDSFKDFKGEAKDVPIGRTKPSDFPDIPSGGVISNKNVQGILENKIDNIHQPSVITDTLDKRTNKGDIVSIKGELQAPETETCDKEPQVTPDHIGESDDKTAKENKREASSELLLSATSLTSTRKSSRKRCSKTIRVYGHIKRKKRGRRYCWTEVSCLEISSLVTAILSLVIAISTVVITVVMPGLQERSGDIHCDSRPYYADLYIDFNRFAERNSGFIPWQPKNTSYLAIEKNSTFIWILIKGDYRISGYINFHNDETGIKSVMVTIKSPDNKKTFAEKILPGSRRSVHFGAIFRLKKGDTIIVHVDGLKWIYRMKNFNHFTIQRLGQRDETPTCHGCNMFGS